MLTIFHDAYIPKTICQLSNLKACGIIYFLLFCLKEFFSSNLLQSLKKLLFKIYTFRNL